MPTRKVKDKDEWKLKICRDREHSPPGMMVFEEGSYEHECPRCHHITYFTIIKPTLSSDTGKVYRLIDGVHRHLTKKLFNI